MKTAGVQISVCSFIVVGELCAVDVVEQVVEQVVHHNDA